MMRFFWIASTISLFIEMLSPLFVPIESLPLIFTSIDSTHCFSAALLLSMVGAVAAFFASTPFGIRQLFAQSRGSLSDFRLCYDCTIVSTLLISDLLVLSGAVGAILSAEAALVLPSMIIGLVLNVAAYPNFSRALRLLKLREA